MEDQNPPPEEKQPDTITIYVLVRKETGQIAVATPWWEVLPSNTIMDGTSKMMQDAGAPKDSWPERKFKIGSLTQVGWLLQGNDDGIWLGVGPGIMEHYEHIGEL